MSLIKQTEYQAPEITYMARALVQATLPHRAPCENLLVWSRTNGNLQLSIRPGWDTKNNKSLGYPYGVIPRLLLFWLTTEALKTGNRRIELGRSLSSFMKNLGLNPGAGSGPRSDAYRLRQQMERLFRATISFDVIAFNAGSGLSSQSWLDMQIAPLGEFWWNPKLADESALFNSWVELGEKFYDAILNNPVPLNMEALQALRNSPLALDLYAWASYKNYSLVKSCKNLVVSWNDLAMQLGAEYGRMIDFKRKIIQALIRVQKVYEGLSISETENGLLIKPGKLSVPLKPSTSKLPLF